MAHRHRHEWTDAQRVTIEPLLSAASRPTPVAPRSNRGGGQPLVRQKRRVGLRAPRDRRPPGRPARLASAARHGPHTHARVDRWCATGVWGRIAHASGDPDLAEAQFVDATTTVTALTVESVDRGTEVADADRVRQLLALLIVRHLSSSPQSGGA